MILFSRIQTGGNKSNPDRACSIWPTTVLCCSGKSWREGVLVRETAPMGDMHTWVEGGMWGEKERERDFKEELVHMVMEASRTKICRVGQHARDWRMSCCCRWIQRQPPGQVLSCRGRSAFHSIQAFSWLDEPHPHYGGQSALFKVHWFKCKSHPEASSQKHPG